MYTKIMTENVSVENDDNEYDSEPLKGLSKIAVDDTIILFTSIIQRN